MKILTETAVMCCDHQAGLVAIAASQSLVRINGLRVLVKGDPVGKGIAGCPNMGPTIKPCTTTTSVTAGYSSFVKIDGRTVCLDTIEGLTDGTPPGTVKYSVRAPGQKLVECAS
jgi:uncharacterized Zn-binding protein involved in type VI secretion